MIAATVFAGILNPVSAQEPNSERMQKAIQLFDNDDRVGAFPILLSLEGTNDPRILARLGACYLSGRGVKQNPAKAFSCFSRAKDDPDGIALNGLGACYGYGFGTEKDTGKALEFWEKAWKKGNLYAASNLGRHYRKTGDTKKAKEYLIPALKTKPCPNTIRGVLEFELFAVAVLDNDPKASEYYLQEAVTHGESAYAKAAFMYNFGEEGFPIDPEKAFALAEKAGDRDLAMLIAFGLGIEKMFWDEKDAVKYLVFASNAGYSKAHWYAFHLTKDRQYAIKAAKAGDKRAYFDAAVQTAVNAEKNKLPKDSAEFKTALDWYIKASKGDDENIAMNALCSIGMMYRIGEGVEADYDKAMEWYQKAADRCFPRALREIGVKYRIRLDKAASGFERSFMSNNMWSYFAIAAFLQDQQATNFLIENLGNIGKEQAQTPEMKLAVGVMFLLKSASEGGNPQDGQDGIKMIEEAAASGNLHANIVLANCFLYGILVKKDIGKAAEYLEKAADKGNIYAKSMLTKEFFRNYVSTDKRIAYLKDSISAGYPWARHNLASVYEGMGNLDQAIELYEQDAAEGNAHSQFRLCNMIFAGKGKFNYEPTMPPNEKQSRFLDLSHKYLLMTLAQNYGNAECLFGSPMQPYGSRRPSRDNAILQIKGFLDGANGLTELSAIADIASRYAYGNGVRKDLKKAKRLCEYCIKKCSSDNPDENYLIQHCRHILSEIEKIEKNGK